MELDLGQSPADVMTPEDRDALMTGENPVAASFQLSWEQTPVGALARMHAIREAESQGGRILQPKELNERYPDLPEKFNEPTSELVAGVIADRAAERRKLQTAIALGPQDGVQGLMNFSSSLLPHVLDPINAAAGLATGGAASYFAAARAANTARKMGIAMNAAEALSWRSRFLYDVAGNFAGNVAVEPLVAAAANQDMSEYSVKDAFVNAIAPSVLFPAAGLAGRKLMKMAGHMDPKMTGALQDASIARTARDLDPQVGGTILARQLSREMDGTEFRPYAHQPIVVENPRLTPLYHGTRNEFENFDFERSGGMANFAEEEIYAWNYAQGDGGGRKVSGLKETMIVDTSKSESDPSGKFHWNEETKKFVSEDGTLSYDTKEIQRGIDEQIGFEVQYKDARVMKRMIDPKGVIDASTPEGLKTLLNSFDPGNNPFLQRFKKSIEKELAGNGSFSHDFWTTSKSARGDRVGSALKELTAQLKAKGFTGLRFRDDMHMTVAAFDNAFKGNMADRPWFAATTGKQALETGDKALLGEYLGEGRLYLSDNPNAANGAAARSGNDAPGSVHTVDLENVRMLNLDAELPEPVAAILAKHLDGQSLTGRDLVEALSAKGLDGEEAEAFFDALAKDLQDAGYDGLAYRQDRLMGEAHDPHNVAVVFDPKKVASRESVPADRAKVKGMTREELQTVAERELDPEHSFDDQLANYDQEGVREVKKFRDVVADAEVKVEQMRNETAELIAEFDSAEGFGHTVDDSIKREIEAIKALHAKGEKIPQIVEEALRCVKG